jgi:hypothetical protein
VTHLNQPAQKLIEEYYSAKQKQIQELLNNNWLNSAGMDISNIYRGKIAMIKEMLETKNVFDTFEKLEKDIKETEDKLKGAK